MNTFRKISPEDMENAIKIIGSDWLLLTLKDKDNKRVNTMTASWGALGVLWNKSVCIIFVRPQRHTHKLLNEQNKFSIAVLDESQRDILKICGRESGRDVDKPRKCGLDIIELDGVPSVESSRLVMICKKLYEDELKEDAFLDKDLLKNYINKDYHTFYVCQIESVYVKED